MKLQKICSPLFWSDRNCSVSRLRLDFHLWTGDLLPGSEGGPRTCPVWGAVVTARCTAFTGAGLERGLVKPEEGVYLGVSCSRLNSLQGLTCAWLWAREINDTALVCSHSEGALAKTGQGRIVLKRVRDILIKQGDPVCSLGFIGSAELSLRGPWLILRV